MVVLEKDSANMSFYQRSNIFRLTVNTESPFSYQKFSPKNFYLPFEHMHVVLNIVKK
jgi:hypothetical protein